MQFVLEFSNIKDEGELSLFVDRRIQHG